jgi:hypothetical protein
MKPIYGTGNYKTARTGFLHLIILQILLVLLLQLENAGLHDFFNAILNIRNEDLILLQINKNRHMILILLKNGSNTTRKLTKTLIF